MMSFAAHASRGTTQPLFESDGTVDTDDKQHLLGMYSGIAFFDPGATPNELLQLAGEFRGGMNEGGFSS